MPWRALTLQLDRAAAEAFSDALLEAGAQSVALSGARVEGHGTVKHALDLVEARIVHPDIGGAPLTQRRICPRVVAKRAVDE